MLQHLLRRLVFDVPILNEYAKMPLKVWTCLNRSLDNQNFIETKQINKHGHVKMVNEFIIQMLVCQIKLIS